MLLESKTCDNLHQKLFLCVGSASLYSILWEKSKHIPWGNIEYLSWEAETIRCNDLGHLINIRLLANSHPKYVGCIHSARSYITAETHVSARIHISAASILRTRYTDPMLPFILGRSHSSRLKTPSGTCRLHVIQIAKPDKAVTWLHLAF